jgi:hypothetical protein
MIVAFISLNNGERSMRTNHSFAGLPKHKSGTIIIEGWYNIVTFAIWQT